MFTGLYWCLLVFIDVYWCLLMFTGVYWCLLVFIDVYWCLLMCIGVYWCLLVFIDVYWCLLMCIGVYWCLLVFIDVYWCLLMFTGVSPKDSNRIVFSYRKTGLQMLAVFSFTVSATLKAEWTKERWRCRRRCANRRNPFQATNFMKHETTGAKICSCLKLFVCICGFY